MASWSKIKDPRMRSQARDFSLEVGGSLPCLHGQSNACRAARAAHRSVRARTFASWPWPGLSSGFTFSFLKKISVTTGNGIPAEISRFSGNFDRKEFSNSKFRNFGIPAGFSVHLAGFSVLFTEK